MGGIAGAVDLSGGGRPLPGVLAAMTAAMRHRGPDGETFFSEGGVHLASCRLDVGGPPEAATPDGLHVAFDGVLYHEAAGERVADADRVRRLYRAQRDGFLEGLRGQFALAVYDAGRRRVVLARDRVGICPLYFTRQDGWLLFASEIKALLASGLVPARPDRRGLNHLFTFFGLPGPRTCFEGVWSLTPGQWLEVDAGGQVSVRTFWRIDFPRHGEEETGTAEVLVQRLEDTLTRAIARRLDAGVPVASYLSGGADSSLVVALARKLRGEPPPTFTVRIDDPRLDESGPVALIAARLGCKPVAVTVGREETLAAYPGLVEAAESPVIDTACAALYLLAREASRQGFKAALTGEGADEWMGSYPWFRVHKVLGYLDVIPGLGLSQTVRRLFLRLSGAPLFPKEVVRRTMAAVGGPNPWLDMYGLMSLSKLRFFSAEMKEVMAEGNPYADLGLDLERMKGWHPFNRGLALGARAHLPGLLLKAKGDNVASRSAVQMRYPFLDEDVFEFLSRLHPSWKMRGLTDKYLLRLLVERHLPREIAWKRKALFQAPFEGFHQGHAPPYVEQLCSRESLRKTGYFDPAAVAHWRTHVGSMKLGSTQRTSVDMGIAGVVSTQLWHHLFIDPTLADLPAWERPAVAVGEPGA